MKQVKSVRFQKTGITLMIDARAAGISRLIDCSKFVEVSSPHKASLRFTKEDGPPFWVYNLSNSANTLKGLQEAIRNGKETYILPYNHILAEDEYLIKETLSQALVTALSREVSAEILLSSLGFLSFSLADLAMLEDNQIPKRFNTDLGIRTLGMLLFEVLGTPPYFKANKTRFWTVLLKKCK